MCFVQCVSSPSAHAPCCAADTLVTPRFLHILACVCVCSMAWLAALVTSANLHALSYSGEALTSPACHACVYATTPLCARFCSMPYGNNKEYQRYMLSVLHVQVTLNINIFDGFEGSGLTFCGRVETAAHRKKALTFEHRLVCLTRLCKMTCLSLV
jgi:hypothetical protein